MIKNPKIWLGISVATIVVSVVLIIAVRPVWGIDFVGGSLLEVRTGSEAVLPITQLLADQFSISATVQPTPEGTVLVRTPPLSEENHQAIVSALEEQNLAEEELRFESIGPTIGEALRRRALIATAVASVAILLYMTYEFRTASGMVSPWKLGVAAVYALLHDLLIVVALFVVLGKLYNAPIDSLFLTAMLAIMGYSVNDTIVIFNRFRSLWTTTRSGSLLSIIDQATRDTLMRSLNTGLATLLVILCLLIFGGTTIRWFMVALAAGTITGTYSSIFVAPPLLYFMTKR